MNNEKTYNGIINEENINQERLNNEYHKNKDRKNNTKIFLYILLILQIMLLIFQILLILLQIFDIGADNSRQSFCHQSISCTDCNGTTCTCIYCASESCDDIREITCPDRTEENSSSSTGTR